VLRELLEYILALDQRLFELANVAVYTQQLRTRRGAGGAVAPRRHAVAHDGAAVAARL
jgi:hypothetical protein